MKNMQTLLVVAIAAFALSAQAVPTRAKALTTPGMQQPPQGIAIGDMVDINTASAETLEALPGITPAKARAIIAARPFTKTEDLLKVKGIKRSTYQRIRNNIRID